LEEVKRSAGYSLNLNNSEIAISDDRLEPGWYRIISAAGTEMPTEAPGTFRCKTWYPIWLDGIDNYSLYVCMILSMCLCWEDRGYCPFIYRFDKTYLFLPVKLKPISAAINATPVSIRDTCYFALF
jgi:hypothetical protein